MPKVRLLTRSASPAGCFEPGAERDFPAAQAEALVRAGSAEPIGWELKAKASTGTSEAEQRQTRGKDEK